MTLYEKPFQSDSEKELPEVHIRIGSPQVRPHVVPAAGKTADLTKADFVTSFLVAWQPVPTPPPHWIELLRQAPFGTQTVRARDLHWDGRYLSIEILNESDIEAFNVEMPAWVDFANAEFPRHDHDPAEQALADARKRAEELENRLRRQTRS
ncbi:MAG TPA: hypothetical protein VFL12_12380 [Thermoanaerobaculia bacterium]|nr:hypothetical protein [Thermoanaerobaculia bacterium]